MQIIYPNCAGLDVQNKIVVVCCINTRAKGDKCCKTRTFGNTTPGLLALSDWLSSNNITHVALDNTGKFWSAVYHLLEPNFEVLAVDVHRFMDVPGRLTDMEDAEWIAELLLYGLLRGSFIHPVPRRTLQELTRHRHKLVQERASVADRLHKLLDSANVKMATVVSDVIQISTLSMLEKIAEAQANVSTVVDLAKKSLHHKQQGAEPVFFKRVQEHHRFLIANHLSHIEFLEQQICVLSAKIDEYVQAEISPAKTQGKSAKKSQEPKKADNNPSAKLFSTWEEAWEAFLKGGKNSDL